MNQYNPYAANGQAPQQPQQPQPQPPQYAAPPQQQAPQPPQQYLLPAEGAYPFRILKGYLKKDCPQRNPKTGGDLPPKDEIRFQVELEGPRKADGTPFTSTVFGLTRVMGMIVEYEGKPVETKIYKFLKSMGVEVSALSFDQLANNLHLLSGLHGYGHFNHNRAGTFLNLYPNKTISIVATNPDGSMVPVSGFEHKLGFNKQREAQLLQLATQTHTHTPTPSPQPVGQGTAGAGYLANPAQDTSLPF